MTTGATPSQDAISRLANIESALFGGAPSIGGVAIPGSQLQEAVQVLSGASDAITLKSGVVFVTTAGVDAMTLAQPIAGAQQAGGDDGKSLTIISQTAQAHTITTATNGINGNKHIATFAAAIGNQIWLFAFNGVWWMGPQTGITLS